MLHNPHNSVVGKAIAAVVAKLPKHEPGVDPCLMVKPNACWFSSGIEHLFVSIASKMFVDGAWATQRLYPFHQLIYSPHTTIETKCGFDLSVGLLEKDDRLRLIHKILYAKTQADSWCDDKWEWNSHALGDSTNEHIFGELLKRFLGFIPPNG